jgi:hypothetical protein
MAPHDAAARIAALMGYGEIAVAGSGASGPLADDLSTRLDVDLTRMTSGQEAAACGQLLDSLDDRAIRFRRHPALDAAVGAAALRSVGDGGKVWAQARSTAPIAAIVAGSAAAWNLRRTREESGGQVVVAFG